MKLPRFVCLPYHKLASFPFYVGVGLSTPQLSSTTFFETLPDRSQWYTMEWEDIQMLSHTSI